MTPKKPSPTRLILLLALGVWFITTAIAVALSSRYLQIPDWQEIIFRFIFSGMFLAPPALAFTVFLLGSLKNKASIWGRTVSALAALLALWLLVFLVRSGLGAVQKAAVASCHSNFEQISMSLLMYANDNGDILPPADSWVDATLPSYTKSIKAYKCPADFTNARSSYAMNANLSGIALNKINYPDRLVLLYETNTPGANPSGRGGISLRHEGKGYIAFADGQVATFDPATKSPPLEWELSP